jgi:putative flippase GtrA
MKEMAYGKYSLSIVKNEIITQAVKYFIVGGLCTIIDFVLLFILTHFLGLHYITSSVFSFMSGNVLNYYLCTLWIFKIRTINNRYHEFIYYSIITGIGLGINTIFIWSFTEFLGLYFMISKIIATLATYWWNFGARKYFLHTIK